MLLRKLTDTDKLKQHVFLQRLQLPSGVQFTNQILYVAETNKPSRQAHVVGAARCCNAPLPGFVKVIDGSWQLAIGESGPEEMCLQGLTCTDCVANPELSARQPIGIA